MDKQVTWALREVQKAFNSLNAKVYLFGSRANKTHNRFSDIDIAVEAINPIPLAQLAALREFFEESHLLCKVDLIDLNSVDNQLRDKVLTEGVLWKG